ncbi:MAG: conserved repeat domain protein, partial [Conexibacter sp.]|nr:conserved repeat domain protein [Conexibacter sp.]
MKSSRVRGRGAAALLVHALAGIALASFAAAAASAATYPSPSQEQEHTVRSLPEGPAIVGGSQIAVTQAPWQVYVQAQIPLGGGLFRTYSCGGSILAATQIVTAAHCVFDATSGLQIPNAEFVVRAGASQVNPSNPAASPYPGENAPPVTAIRVHPRYDYNLNAAHVSPDDVAVLVLAAPGLTLDAATEAPIAPAAGGAYPVLGTLASITGFGRQTQDPNQQPNGFLYGTTTTIGDAIACGGAANALLDCVSSPTSSACQGDSGGPLTIGGALHGVASFIAADGPSGACGAGSTNGYTNLAAPEIRDFALGSDAPPLAPRGGTDIQMQGNAAAGSSLTCSAGTWTNGPAFAYQFLDTRSGRLLQGGTSATYALTPADVGRRIACHVLATNAGGTGVSRTVATPAIAAGAARPLPPA